MKFTRTLDSAPDSITRRMSRRDDGDVYMDSDFGGRINRIGYEYNVNAGFITGFPRMTGKPFQSAFLGYAGCGDETGASPLSFRTQVTGNAVPQ